MVKRVKLSLVPGLEIEFVDRNRAIQQVVDWSERGTRLPIVVFGPEGCGKSAWLRQAAEVLKEMSFDVIYIDALHREFFAHTDVVEVSKRLSEAVADTVGYPAIKLADLVIQLVKELMRRLRKRIALLVDEVFQAIGLEKAEAYVKSLLNLIEYPPEPYERIVIIVATSEGLSRWRIGRHLWSWIMPMWNMSRKGFEELYERLPGPKPGFEDVWRLTGGNPRMLTTLYLANWSVNSVVEFIARSRAVTKDFVSKWGRYLEKAVEDPDALMDEEVPEELRHSLIEKNLVVYDMYSRSPDLWIDEPPPEKDPEIGVGKYVAWQTPLHREAVRKALEKYKGS